MLFDSSLTIGTLQEQQQAMQLLLLLAPVSLLNSCKSLVHKSPFSVQSQKHTESLFFSTSKLWITSFTAFSLLKTPVILHICWVILSTVFDTTNGKRYCFLDTNLFATKKLYQRTLFRSSLIPEMPLKKRFMYTWRTAQHLIHMYQYNTTIVPIPNRFI